MLDDFRDEEPGKILHEFRYGELVAFEERPESPYYGSADATPLYVVLLDEYERWTGDADLVREFEDEARAALDWIDEYGDMIGDGYVRYRRRNERTGLENQCWKDSPEAICYADGRLPAPPRATCELQGYAYDAKLRGARLAREFWGDPAYADRLEREAAELKERFNRDFWLADRGYYALALDADGGRSTRWPPTSGTCCGVASSRSPAPRRSPSTCSGRGCSPAGGCGPSPRGRRRTTRWATTSARCGRSTTR